MYRVFLFLFDDSKFLMVGYAGGDNEMGLFRGVKGFIILWAKGKDSGHDLTFFVKKYYGLWQHSCLFEDI